MCETGADPFKPHRDRHARAGYETLRDWALSGLCDIHFHRKAYCRGIRCCLISCNTLGSPTSSLSRSLGFLWLFLQIDPLSSASVVQAVLFGLVVFFLGIRFLRLLKTFVGFAFLGTASVLVSTPLARVSLMAWSELLFICILLLYLMFSEFYSRLWFIHAKFL